MSALGGVGMFLVGMLLLTDGLKALAGRGMRRALARFTSTPLSGAVTGAVTTATIQSSSATTVTAVGFVASGLLSFPQALGIILGANVGTTITGWLVAILGFKLDLGVAMLPLVFIGALLHLVGRGRVQYAGQALAGFSLLFVGIETMKVGLDAFQGIISPADFPPDTLIGRLELVAIGVLITVVTQSSSAGVATALAALGAGAINLPQAAAMVIGMDVGTTFTALLATLGGGTMARRTGLAHVVYNLMAGTLAFVLLGPFAAVASRWASGGDGQIALVAFHSSFNLLGVSLVLPFARPFSRLIEWLVPERDAPLTRALDSTLLSAPRLATEMAAKTVDALSAAVAGRVCWLLNAPPSDGVGIHDKEDLEAALRTTRGFVEQIDVSRDGATLTAQVQSMFHILDHLGRLVYRCDQTSRIAALSDNPDLRRLRDTLVSAATQHARPDDPAACERALDSLRAMMRQQRKAPRDRIITAVVQGRIPDDVASMQLDALRWLHRVSYHLWRIRLHLNAIHATEPAVAPVDEARIDVDQD